MSNNEHRPSQKLSCIAEQNDLFRRSLGQNPAIPGALHVTESVAFSDAFKHAALAAVRDFSCFTEDNDPHAEHDFGVVMVNGEKLFWKIDLYDPEYVFGSEDRENPAVTRRLLTIMHASEY